MARPRRLDFQQGLAKQANYSPVFGDKSSPAGLAMYKKQRTAGGKKILAKRSENPNYIASRAFGAGDDVKMTKLPKIQKTKSPPKNPRRASRIA